MKICYWFFFLGGYLRLNAPFFAHRLVLEIKLLILNPVEGLFLGFTHEHRGQQVFQRKLDCVIASPFTVTELLLVDFDFGPEFDPFFFGFLSVSCRQIRLVIIRIFPELSVEHMVLLFDSALFPV